MKALLKDTRLDALMSTIVDGVIIIDRTGTIAAVNTAVERVFGYSHDELVGKNVRMLMPHHHSANHDQYISNYVRTRKAQIIGIGREVEGQRADGTVFPLDLSIGELQADDETFFVGVLRDLSAKHAQQREFDDLQARHFHLSRISAMNEMGTTIAHEINQPLAANANYVETALLMLDAPEADTEKISAVLEDALAQNKRAAEIIARMRRFIERGDVALQRIDLEQVIDDALAIGLSKDKHLGLTVTSETRTDHPAKADPVQIQQVLVNLIRNACEAMADAPEKHLSITVEDDPDAAGFLVLSVCDTGPGVAEEVIPDLFTAFTTTKPGGMGVGLSISRSIVRAHGGRIWARNRDEGGAEFAFTVPALESGA